MQIKQFFLDFAIAGMSVAVYASDPATYERFKQQQETKESFCFLYRNGLKTDPVSFSVNGFTMAVKYVLKTSISSPRHRKIPEFFR